jgi:hypothetical protein
VSRSELKKPAGRTVEVVLNPRTKARQGDNDPYDLSDVPGDAPGQSIVLPFVLKNRSPLRELISPTEGIEDAPCLMRVDTTKTLLLSIAKARAWAAIQFGACQRYE